MDMTAASIPDADADAASRSSWMSIVIIVMAQIMMVFNISTLQVSIEGIASSFGTSATAIGTVIVTYALTVAALILVGARIAQVVGSLRVFRISVAAFGVGMLVMALSPSMTVAIVAQVIAGAAAAALAPTLVVLVADNYRAVQRDQALAWLGAAPAMGIVLAFLIAGSLATWVGWRFMFGLLVALSALIYALGRRLSSSPDQSGVTIDRIGVVLAALAILLICVGASNLTAWGILLACPGAPFSILDMSPAPLAILCGIFLIQAFVAWSRRTADTGGLPLISPAVIDTRIERAALFSIFIISALASAVTFLIPLYIQVIQDGSSLQTAIAVIPFSIASFIAAVLVVRLFDRLSPRDIGRVSFLAVAAGVAWLGAVVRNDWHDVTVMLGMVLAGLGEGALVTLLFNVVVSASPEHLAGDVGSARGATNNLATAVGTASAGALVVGLLSSVLHTQLVHDSRIPAELKEQVDLNSPAFVSNAQLHRRLATMNAQPAQIAEALRINADARLVALKLTLFTFSGLALLAIFPAGALPDRTRSLASDPALADN
jgi:MFS family permease